MNQSNRLLLSAVAEAVLVAVGSIEIEDYGHWEYLVDNVCWLHELLNDKKPSSTEGTRR
jgi:hypothetical protein